jgi:hypothetical protein
MYEQLNSAPPERAEKTKRRNAMKTLKALLVPYLRRYLTKLRQFTGMAGDGIAQYKTLIYVCMYVCMYVCIVYVCMHMCMYVRMYVSMIFSFTQIAFLSSCMYVCMYVCMSAGMVHIQKYSSHSSQHKRLTHRKIQISAVRLQRFFWAITGSTTE